MKTAFLALYALCAAVPMYASQQMPLSLDLDAMPSTEQESLMSNMDVVELMRLTGHYEPWLEEQRLVQVFDEDAPRTMTEGDKLRLKRQGRAFMDITDHPALGQLNKQRGVQQYNSPLTLSSTRNVTSDVKAIFSNLDDTHLRQDIQDLTAFYTRNYRSDWGRKSSDWVYTHVEAILSKATKVKTSVTKFPHRFPQSSVIARIEDPEDDTKDKPVVIVGAHQDSLNYMLPFYRAPGADDDGSGTVTIFQVLRSLIEHKFVPPKGLAVEFMWFAAEEGGLLGSQDIASSYEESGRKVKGMLQLDMVAFVKQGTTPIVAFFKDVVDAELTAFGTKLAERYIPLPWNMTGCGSSCGSDHMSFTKAGYPAMFATEGLFENGPRTIHTHKDDLNTDEYSFDHMLQFVKFGIAFAVELAVA